jgi:hypothetical protein
MSKKITAIIIAVVLLSLAMFSLYITAKSLENADFFYGIFISLGFMVAGWVAIGIAFMEKKKEKKGLK